MATLAISDKFMEDCSPVIDSNYATCGTITKSNIDHLSKTDLDTLFTASGGGLFRDLDAWFFHSIEMKACGTRRYAWYDWIMANADRSMYTQVYRDAVRPGTRAVKGPGLLQPWIMGRQEAVVNRDYWKLEGGAPVGSYTENDSQVIGTFTSGPIGDETGGTHIIRVSNRHGMPLDANWFREKEVIHVFTLTAGVAQMGNWRVIRAEVDTNRTYIDVLVTSENLDTSEPYYAFGSAAAKTGVIIPGINNVSDFEYWCKNLPNVDPRNMVPFWYQTWRNARCVDSEYLAVFKRLMASNEAFRQFGDLDMAERNRQDELEQQKRFVNAFFFQKSIHTNQDLTNWESLDAINTVTEVGLTPGLGGKIQGRRANFIGVAEQLRRCARVFDLAGNPLNLQEFFAENYNIARVRKTLGRSVTRIDWYTNAWFREKFFDGMLKYYKEKYTDAARYNFEISRTTTLGFIFDVYRVPFPAGIEIALISDEFFDDWYSEHEAMSQGQVGNLMLCLDIGKPGPNGGTIYFAQLAANRKQYSTARIEELAKYDSTFRCVMATISETQTLTSETGTVIVECPSASAWIQNIQMDVPYTLGQTVPYSDLYYKEV